MGIVAARLSEAMSLRDVDQTDLASAVGATQGAISKILVGKTANSRLMPKIATFLEVQLPWLLGMSDERELDDRGDDGFTLEERNLVNLVRALPPADKKAIVQLVKTIAASAISPSVHGKQDTYRGE